MSLKIHKAKIEFEDFVGESGSVFGRMMFVASGDGPEDCEDKLLDALRLIFTELEQQILEVKAERDAERARSKKTACMAPKPKAHLDG